MGGKIHCQQVGLLILASASGQGAIPWGGIYFPALETLTAGIKVLEWGRV